MNTRPQMLPSGTRNYRNRATCTKIENHATFFPWSLWRAAWIAGASALRRRTMSPNMAAKLAAILQLIARPSHAASVYSVHLWYCYNQLTPVRKMISADQYHVTVSLKFRAHWGHVFFFKLTDDLILAFDWIVGPRQINLLTSAFRLGSESAF